MSALLAFSLPPPKRPLDDDKDAVRMLLARALNTYAGRRGQSDFADLLADVSGRPVTQSQISHWTTGLHPVPEWVQGVLPKVLRRVVETCLARASEAEEVERLVGIRHIARTRQIDDGPPDDGAPLGGPEDYRPDDDDPAP
jgi:hypothetical protein